MPDAHPPMEPVARNSDPRVDLSDELLPDHALAAVAALDSVRVLVAADPAPASALTAAALTALLARTHAHVGIQRDVPLPRNPWGAASLTDLLERLSRVRPPEQAEISTTFIISSGTEPGADRYVAALPWTVQVTDSIEQHLATLRAAGDTDTYTEPAGPGSGLAPYGGFLGAATAASEVFRQTLAPLGLPSAPWQSTFTWNLIGYTHAPAPALTGAASKGQPARGPAWPRLVLAGCGSVGSSAATALACEDLAGLQVETVDDDLFDSRRNPFRYPAATGHESGPKADWLAQTLTAAGANATAIVGPVRNWTIAQPDPGLNGILVSSVDSVDGRYEVADVLARTTLSAAVHALSFHVQREHLGDGFRCPFCDFVSVASPLSQAGADARLTGLPEQRIIELLRAGGRLHQQDVDQMVAMGTLSAQRAQGLVGGRLADLRRRLYAQAAVPALDASAAPPAPLSAPFVSWATGVALAAEVAKHARGLPMVDRRLEVDLHGYPGNFLHRRRADATGRCACASRTRVRWMRRLYPADIPFGH